MQTGRCTPYSSVVGIVGVLVSALSLYCSVGALSLECATCCHVTRVTLQDPEIRSFSSHPWGSPTSKKKERQAPSCAWPIPSVHPGRGCVKDRSGDSCPSYRSVLGYLTEMIDVCRRLHRQDLEGEYQDAYQTAVFAIYGQLPERNLRGSAVGQAPAKPKVVPPWRRAIAARPFRKIKFRVADEEVLECGHRMWSPLPYDAETGKLSTRRRCRECGEEASKKPAAAAGENPAEENLA